MVVFAAGFAATGILVPWLKSVVGFPRPLAGLGRELVTVVGPDAHAASFPSGHAAFVFLMCAVLSPGTSCPLKWLLWVFAAVVALSRMAVGAHFPAAAVAIVLRTAIARARRKRRVYRRPEAAGIGFDSLDEVRQITAGWRERYNEIRPHDALGSLPPARYRERLLAAETPVQNCLRNGGAYGSRLASALRQLPGHPVLRRH